MKYDQPTGGVQTGAAVLQTSVLLHHAPARGAASKCHMTKGAAPAPLALELVRRQLLLPLQHLAHRK